MAGFRIKLNDGKYIGFNGYKMIRTTIEDAHIYHSVLSVKGIAKMMIKDRSISISDKPVIVNKKGEIVLEVTE